MNKILRNLLVVAAVTLLAVAPVTAAGHTSIVDVAVSDGRFDTLVAAVQYAGLVETLDGGEWTVFAPTDEAFAKLDLNADNIASAFSKEDLTDILLYHVLEGKVSSAEAKAAVGDITMANGDIAGLKYYEGDLYVNDDSKVIIPNVLADNGYIHVVDTVILPPWPKTEEPVSAEAAGGPMVTEESSIVEIAVADGRFDTLVAAVTYTGLADALSGGEWTVFAPTDAAFAKLDLNADNIAGAFTKEELTNILLYHALDSKVSSAEAEAAVGDITMANGDIAGLKVYEGDLYVNDDSKVIIPNILASNGYIHVVDTVILPPWPK